MKKALMSVLLASLVLSVPVLAADSQSTETQSMESQSTEVQSTEMQSDENDKDSEAAYMKDFTVETIDGSTFTLSEALKDHELALINLWATWCPHCEEEFPAMQEAWDLNADKVAVIALSVEPKDTMEDLKTYAAEHDLSFPIGLAGDTNLKSYANHGIPTSILVGSDRRILASVAGSLEFADQFVDLFEGHSDENYNSEECTYTLYVVDEELNSVADATIGFCTDTVCNYATTDEDGKAVFKGNPAKYHIQIIEAPDGYSDELDEEMYTEPFDQTFYILMKKK